jgi:regulator of cell morphogenesis and NO signaling
MDSTRSETETPSGGTEAAADLALADRSLGEIAIAWPAAIAVFRREGLDFCCGGNVPLREAAAARGLSLEALEAELVALGERDAGAPERASPAALIEHILRRFHAVHRREIPDLAVLARKVEAVHRDHPLVPKGLAAALTELGSELELHMAKEEQVLFPLMRNGGGAMPIVHPITRMRHEHDEHGVKLRRIAEITHDLALPSDACNSWRALYAGIEKLVADVMQHIHTENNLLFPQFAPVPAPLRVG